MTWVGPIKYYAYQETDEDPECEIEQGINAGLTKELAYHLANTNPLYEVGFEFYVDPDTQRYFIAKVDLGNEIFERPLPRSSMGCPQIHIDKHRWERDKDEFDYIEEPDAS